MNKTFATEIFINGEVHTLDRENPLAQAIAVYQGKFLFIGSNDEVMQFQNAETKIIDLNQCCGACHVHGHQHDIARQSSIPVSDDNAFWGALGCSCFAF